VFDDTIPSHSFPSYVTGSSQTEIDMESNVSQGNQDPSKPLSNTAVDSAASLASHSGKIPEVTEVDKDNDLDTVGEHAGEGEDQRKPSDSQVFGGLSPSPSNLSSTTVDSDAPSVLTSEHTTEINKDKAVEKDAPDIDMDLNDSQGGQDAFKTLSNTAVDSAASHSGKIPEVTEVDKDNALDAVGEHAVEDQRKPSDSQVFGGPSPGPSNLVSTTVDSTVPPTLPSEHATEINKDKAGEKGALSCISQEILLLHSGDQSDPDQSEADSETEELVRQTVLHFLK
jgi:hypothetical protein